jgi:hypothetical protein
VVCLLYVGDILTFDGSITDTIIKMDLVLDIRTAKGGSINLGKLLFLRDKIDFLDHTIGKGALLVMAQDSWLLTILRD